MRSKMTEKRMSSDYIVHCIRERRKQLGLSQEELGEVAEVSLPTISRIERGKETARLDVILRLLDALGLEIVLTSRGEVYGKD